MTGVLCTVYGAQVYLFITFIEATLNPYPKPQTLKI